YCGGRAGGGRCSCSARGTRGECAEGGGLTGCAAVELRCAREQQLQMVVQLGHRPDRRARGAHRVGLVDRDCGRDPLDRVDLRLVHSVEELARIRAEGLDVASLTLCVERVEDERGLARARHNRDHPGLSGGDLEREVLEVVLPRAADDDRGAVAAMLHGAIVRDASRAGTGRRSIILFVATDKPTLKSHLDTLLLALPGVEARTVHGLDAY